MGVGAGVVCGTCGVRARPLGFAETRADVATTRKRRCNIATTDVFTSVGGEDERRRFPERGQLKREREDL